MTIAQVSKLYGLSSDTLRYYERVGLLPAVGRTSGGVRNYSDEDLRWVEFIKCMRDAGVSVEALSEYVRLAQQGPGTAEARRRILIEQRTDLEKRMEEIRKTLERLNFKIANYDSMLAAGLKAGNVCADTTDKKSCKDG